MIKNKKIESTKIPPKKQGRLSHILVHHYTSKAHLFQTITMYPETKRELIMRNIIQKKSWYWGRFEDRNRTHYMKRRLLVEAQMHQDFLDKYWPLKATCPVYFYLYSLFSQQDIEEKLEQRKQLNEPHTKYLLIDLADLDDHTNVSFTISDSLISYRKKLISQGVVYETPNQMSDYDDHGKIYHISEITQLIKQYERIKDLYFEVQIWDTDVLRRWQSKHGF